MSCSCVSRHMCRLHRDELLNGKSKTVRLNFGKAGWRKLKTIVSDFPKKSTPEMEELCKQIRAVQEMETPPTGIRPGGVRGDPGRV